MKKGFPPPIHHKVVGFASIAVTTRGDVTLCAQAHHDDEGSLLTTLRNQTVNRDLVAFLPYKFLLPVLRGAAFRTGTKWATNRAVDVGAWFGSDYTSMSDCALAAGMSERPPLDVKLAVLEDRLGDVEDQLLVDAFLVLCTYLRQLVVEDQAYGPVPYRAVVERARRAVRAEVKDKECKRFVSKKGQADRKRFLMK